MGVPYIHIYKKGVLSRIGGSRMVLVGGSRMVLVDGSRIVLVEWVVIFRVEIKIKQKLF